MLKNLPLILLLEISLEDVVHDENQLSSIYPAVVFLPRSRNLGLFSCLVSDFVINVPACGIRFLMTEFNYMW